jgi:hypothetical protein
MLTSKNSGKSSSRKKPAEIPARICKIINLPQKNLKCTHCHPNCKTFVTLKECRGFLWDRGPNETNGTKIRSVHLLTFGT